MDCGDLALELPGQRYVVVSIVSVLMSDGADEEEHANIDDGCKATQNCQIGKTALGRGFFHSNQGAP